MAKINHKDHMAELSFIFNLSGLKEEINELLNKFLEKEKSMMKIINYIYIPSIDSIINAKNDQSSITNLFQTTIFSSGSTSIIKPENIENGKKKIYDFYQVYLNSYLLVKSQFYTSLMEHKVFTEDNLTKFFEKCNLDKDLILFLLEGMKYFILMQNHVALFILVPQIERIVKKIAKDKAGISTIKIVPEGEQEKTLGDYFLDEKLVPILGSDLITYCFWFLADKTGLNLRNIVAHGLIKYHEVQNHLLTGLTEIIFLLIQKL